MVVVVVTDNGVCILVVILVFIWNVLLPFLYYKSKEEVLKNIDVDHNGQAELQQGNEWQRELKT